jgi:uncharacterized protein (DUF302 family)
MSNALGFEVESTLSYDEAVERVAGALKEEGFGILTRIDVRETFREKLDEEFRPYVILGACNPQLAHRALSRRAEVGLMLPCNLTVESRPEGGSIVRIGDPDQFMSFGELGADRVIQDVAAEARTRLRRVADQLAASGVERPA